MNKKGHYRLRVTGRAPNYTWRKWTTPKWLQRYEAHLDEQTGGTHAVIERPGRSRIAVEFFCDTRGVGRELVTAFGGSVTRLPADWEAQALESQRIEPLRIGRRLTVQSDSDQGANKAVLVIPAGAAFGTGDHATTAMSLRLLERISRRLPPGWRMLDAGTGSGILALAARRLGAGKVIAIDNDRVAIRTARENARRNCVRGVKFVVADINEQAADVFDIITANLYSELLEAVLPSFRASLQASGHLILSGILRFQEPQLMRALASNGFRILETRRRGKWVALLCSGGL